MGFGGDGRSCAACTLRVAITPSFAGGTTSRSADVTLAAVVGAAAEQACNTAGGFTFSWAATAALNAAGTPLQLAAAAASGPSLTLPARSLGSGQSVTFTFTACLAAAPTSCASNATSFTVAASPLVALIGGGGGLVGETPVTVSGASSSDPDGGALSYAWGCARIPDNAPCAARDGTPVALGSAVKQTVQLAGGASYNITLVVSGSGGRTASAWTTLAVQPGAIPLVSVAGSAALSGAKVDPSQQLVLLANAVAFVPGPVVTRWSLAAQSGVTGPLLDLTDPAICATPVTSASMVLKAGALAQGARYTFTLTATDAVGAVGLANATIATSVPASGGWVSVTPASGVALSTPFVLTAAGWSADADELPLKYSADYFVEGSSAAPVSLTNGAFQDSPTIPCQLPAGLDAAGNVITLRLTVRSAFGATVSSNASATVTWPVFSGAAAVNEFVDGATDRATAALQSGDSSAALQVVGGLAALLNSDVSSSSTPSSTPSGGGGVTGGTVADTSKADAAAAAQRASLLAIVASAVGSAGSSGVVLSTAAVESTSALVSQLVSSPSKMSGAGAASALSVLSAVASAGAAVSPAAAQSVASALSAVVFAPSTTTTTTGASTGGSGSSSSSSSSANGGLVLNVLSSLAASQASGMAVPGQAPVSVVTPVIRMSVSLDDASAGRLFQAPLTAPGAASTFDPLPPGTLDAANGAVSTVFLALAFDPHGSGKSMTRLSFSEADTGAAVPVHNLTNPLLFTLPPAQLANGTRAQCAWWDAASSTYSGAACTALPSPYPPGHNLSFAAAFDASSGPASLAMAWNITGPLADGVCTPVFLDCTDTSAGANRTLLLGNATAAPRLSCGNTTTLVLRAFVGDACGLRNASNALNCSWDLALQAFAGAGCVAANATRCACTHATDFVSSSVSNLPVCSVSDLAALGELSPEEFVADLAPLLIVVGSLFGAMCVGAATAAALDAAARRRALKRLTAPDGGCGFRVARDGVTHLWRFHLDPLPSEIAAPSGAAVQIASVIGMPFARLRAAMPDEFFTTPFCAALGRRHGFSAEGMNAAAELHRELLHAASAVKAPGCVRTATLLKPKVARPRRSNTWHVDDGLEGVAADVPDNDALVVFVSADDGLQGVAADVPEGYGSGGVAVSDADGSDCVAADVHEDSEYEDAAAAVADLVDEVLVDWAADEPADKPASSDWSGARPDASADICKSDVITLSAAAVDEAEGQMVRARESVRISLQQPELSSRLRLGGDDNRIVLEEFVGTALVLGFLQTTQLMDVLTLATWRQAATDYFRDMATPAGRSFDETVTMFLSLLSPTVLDGTDKWWQKARLWKLILSQTADGFWDPSDSVAFALEARPASETTNVKPTRLERMLDRLAGAGDVAESLLVDDGDATPGAAEALDDAANEAADGGQSDDDDAFPVQPRPPGWEIGAVEDDPLQCSARAVLAAMPRKMRLLRLELGAGSRRLDPDKQPGPEELNLARMWTTLCVIAMLESLNVSWLASDGDEYGVDERTMVDAAREWVEAQAVQHPVLESALDKGNAAVAATRTVRRWHRAWARRIGAVRRSEAVLSHASTARAHRTGSELLRALVTRHDTGRIFLSEPLDGLQRWQMWVLAMSILLTQLLVNIWMYYAKGQLCCTALREEAADACAAAAPACPTNTLTMSCADLLTGIAAPASSYPPALVDWTCAAFPDDNLPGDSLIVALIAIAVALPVTVFLQSCFEIANDSEAPESWLRYAGLGRFVFGRMAHHRWHYTGPLGQPRRLARWYIRSASAPLLESLVNAGITIRDAVRSLLRLPKCRRAPAQPASDDDVQAGTAATPRISQQSTGSEGARIRSLSLLASVRRLDDKGYQSDDDAGASSTHSGAHDEHSHMVEALRLRRRKRALTVVGLVSVAALWALLAWFILTYGLLIYKLLGLDAQRSFTRSWGVSYGVGAATEWRDVLRQALTAIAILAIAERMHLTRPVTWLEEQIDYMSTSALLLEHGGLSFFQELRLIFTFRRRLSD